MVRFNSSKVEQAFEVQFIFEMAKERFDWCVINAIAFARHGLNYVKSIIQVSNISTEGLPRNCLYKVPVKYIIACVMFLCLLHDHFVRILSSNLGNKTILVHDPPNLLMVHTYLIIGF